MSAPRRPWSSSDFPPFWRRSSQLVRPSALRARFSVAPVSFTVSISMRPRNKGKVATATSSSSNSTIGATPKPGASLKLSAPRCSLSCGQKANSMGPSSVRSRPVAALTRAMRVSLWSFGSKVARNKAAAPSTTTASSSKPRRRGLIIRMMTPRLAIKTPGRERRARAPYAAARVRRQPAPGVARYRQYDHAPPPRARYPGSRRRLQ